MGALNAVCHDVHFALELSGLTIKSDDSFIGLRSRKSPALEGERFRLAWTSISAASYATIDGIQNAAKASGTIAWTPPGEGADRKFRIMDFSARAESTDAYNVDMTLEYMPAA
jgi:hypothetical protein